MYRLQAALLAAAFSSMGCAEIECDGAGAEATCTDDDRPATIEYITTTILKPSCANAQCHSAFSAAAGYRLDTVEHVRQAGDFLVTPNDSGLSQLYLVLIREEDRMPYDQPLPGPDIALIQRWIDTGADGLVVP